MKTVNLNFWQGDWIDEKQLEEKIRQFQIKSSTDFQISWLLSACDHLSEKLLHDSTVRESVIEAMRTDFANLSETDIVQTLTEVAEFIKKKSLLQKINRELCLSKPQAIPFAFERIDYQTSLFERWAPLGFLVHIAPSNAVNVPFLTLIEGLLCGNSNFLKLPSVGKRYTLSLIAQLIAVDDSKQLANFIIATYLPITKNDLLELMIKQADAVVVWGNEETVQVFRNMTPLHTQLIAWGPKISFAFFDAENFTNLSAIEKLAKDICQFDQQSCSSPQVVYLETEDPDQLNKFAIRLAKAMDRISPNYPALIPDQKEQAEITQSEILQKVTQAFDVDTTPTVLNDAKNNWRIFIDKKSGLRASPLYRTIWLKPIMRKKIIETLRPLRMYLQTVGLQCHTNSLFEISQRLLQSGVTRITEVGQMTSGYLGEPHDGVYALQRYSRRVSIATREVPDGLSFLEDLAPPDLKNQYYLKAENDFLAAKPIMTSLDVANNQKKIQPSDVQVYFKTGGSSGEPKLSIFTYDDYEMQMKFAAQGLFAAGLEPNKDRCINLFFAGGLYGGFLSFFSILEQLKAVQLPMAADPNFTNVGEWIVKQNINVLLGMPTYLMRLFEENESLFLKYGKIDKVFFGGEHLSDANRKELREKFKVKVIRSATYGSNETGPMGYQCQHCEGSVHHVHDQLQHLEIINLKSDVPANIGEVGRLLWTSKIRSGQSISRYEIGDLGRWVKEDCPCGRTSPRFELLGRYGDVFKVGTVFLNYKKFENILNEFPQFTGTFQIVITKNNELRLNFTNPENLEEKSILDFCLSHYPDLDLVVNQDRMLDFKVQKSQRQELQYVKSSGKLRSVIDQRTIDESI